MAQDTINLAARSQRSEKIAGKFFTVISCTAPFDVELEGRARRTVNAGNKISGERFRRISFFETAGASNSIVYDAGENDYQGEVQAEITNATVVVANASLTSLANLGIAVSTAASGGKPACDASGWLTITSGMALLVPGTYNGARRQRIVFTVKTGSSILTVRTGSLPLKVFMIVQPGQTIALDGDLDFYLYGDISGSTDCKCTIGQTFYN